MLYLSILVPILMGRALTQSWLTYFKHPCYEKGLLSYGTHSSVSQTRESKNPISAMLIHWSGPRY